MITRRPGNDAPHQPTAAVSPAPGTSFAHRPWLLALVLVVVTFAAYQPVRHAGFIWDDDDHLTANPAMTAPHGLKMIWSSLAVSRYYPLTLTTFWVQRRLWGLNPQPYHLVNVALHAVNGILVFLVLRRLRVTAAWLAAMVWVLHPVNVESVAWITELKNTQSGVFFFLSMLCFLRSDTQKRHGWYVLAIACGLAAMLSKPSTVVLPLVLLLCAWWERGRWTRMDIVRIAPFFALAVGMSALTILEQRGHVLRAGAANWQLGPAERLVVAGKAIGFYAGKVLWPARLTFVYPRWAVDASSLWSWAPAVALVAVAVTLGRYRSRGWGRAAVFGGGFFVVALLPVLGFFNVYYFRFSYVADHFQYLACLGLISLAASTGAAICERAGPRGRDWGVLAAAVVLLILGVSTWKQSGVYQDSETLWRDTLAKNPQCWMAHNNLATTLKSLGRVQEAVEHWEECLRIKPDYAEAHCNLGYTWQQMGKIEGAIAQYEQALRSKPDFAEAHNNLGTVLLQEGKVSDALGQYEQALRSNPDYAEAHNNLGTVLLQEGKVSDALGQYEQALRSNPDYAEAHYNLGIALVRLGRVQEAVGHWEQALRIKPDYAEAQYSLGTTLQQAGHVPEAIGHYEQALRSNPDYAEAHYNLGVALGQTGRIREAMEHWQQALRIKPDYAEAHGALGMALEQAGQVREAIGHYEQALRIKPDFTPAKNALARLRASQ